MRVRIAAVAAAAVVAVGAAAGSAQACAAPSIPAPPQVRLPAVIIAPLLGSPFGPEDGDLLEGAPPAGLSGSFDGAVGD